LQRALTADIEANETKELGKPGPTTANQLGHWLAWSALKARAFDEALDATTRSLAIVPDSLMTQLYRAHALLLLGRKDEALAAYLGQKGHAFTHADKTTVSWEEQVSTDFKWLREAGVDSPDFAVVLAALGKQDRPPETGSIDAPQADGEAPPPAKATTAVRRSCSSISSASLVGRPGLIWR